jgi:hypothetical protein
MRHEDHVALYPQKLTITPPTSGGRSVGRVRSWTQTMEIFFLAEWTSRLLILSLSPQPGPVRGEIEPRQSQMWGAHSNLKAI